MTVIGLVILARVLGLFQGLEWKTLDSFLRLRPAESQDERLLIVGIDEADIQRTGTYPIPDEKLAALLQTLSQSDPQAIGIDIFRDLPVEPGHETLVATLAGLPNVFGIEKIMGAPVGPPPSLPPERIGFIDFPLDQDGFVRRAYLGTLPPVDHPDPDRFRFSLALKLAEGYLAEAGLPLENGVQNPANMRFGDTELFQFQPSSGGYVGTQSAGVQVLINPRSGKSPFEIVSMTDVLEGRVDTDSIRDRIVLIGITSLSAKDLVNSAAVNTDNPGLFYGVEMQAHIISQVLSAALNQRPMLGVWGDTWEHLWIAFWGTVGILLVRYISRPAGYMLWVGLGGLTLAGASLALLWLGGWWIPVVPTLLVFAVNGGVLPGFYLYDQTLRSRIDERQRVIERTYDAIHNGPLQTLALLLKQKDTLEPSVSAQLTSLNRELREVYTRLQQESLPQEEQLQLGGQRVIDLRHPLHEVLYEVYTETLRRDFPGFGSLKFQVVTFEPLQVEGLSADERRSLCRFLEEALCNVGKHAIEAKRLTVQCLATDTENLICVKDNGTPHPSDSAQANPARGGRGTQQAEALALRLHGTFQRACGEAGTACELRWPLRVPKGWWRR
ncbi:MAG: CHASE2 domain-containing protein [Leptolyngbya sp. SIO1E4]|nr:CHASE2 domain-containing protein [Leptolyngbya sp. SIO1E4]